MQILGSTKFNFSLVIVFSCPLIASLSSSTANQRAAQKDYQALGFQDLYCLTFFTCICTVGTINDIPGKHQCLYITKFLWGLSTGSFHLTSLTDFWTFSLQWNNEIWKPSNEIVYCYKNLIMTLKRFWLHFDFLRKAAHKSHRWPCCCAREASRH